MTSETLTTTCIPQHSLEEAMDSMESSVPRSTFAFIQSTEEKRTMDDIKACTSNIILKSEVFNNTIDVCTTLSNFSEGTSGSHTKVINCDSDELNVELVTDVVDSSNDRRCDRSWDETEAVNNSRNKTRDVGRNETVRRDTWSSSSDSIVDDGNFVDIDKNIINELRSDESNVEATFETVLVTYSNPFESKSNVIRDETETDKIRMHNENSDSHAEIIENVITLSSDSSDDDSCHIIKVVDYWSENNVKSYVDVSDDTLLHNLINFSNRSCDISEVNKNNLNTMEYEEKNEDVTFVTVSDVLSNRGSDFNFDDQEVVLIKAQEEDIIKDVNFETVLLQSNNFSNRNCTNFDVHKVNKNNLGITQEDNNKVNISTETVTHAFNNASFCNIDINSMKKDKYKLKETQSDCVNLDINIETYNFLGSCNEECFDTNLINMKSHNLDSKIEVINLTSDSSCLDNSSSNDDNSIQTEANKCGLNTVGNDNRETLNFVSNCVSDHVHGDDGFNSVSEDIYDESDIEIIDTTGFSDWDTDELEKEISQEVKDNLHIKKKRKRYSSFELKTNYLNNTSLNTSSNSNNSLRTEANSNSYENFLPKKELNNSDTCEKINNFEQSIVSDESNNASDKKSLNIYNNFCDLNNSNLSQNACDNVSRDLSKKFFDESKIDTEDCESFVENSCSVSENLSIFSEDNKMALTCLSDSARDKFYNDKETSVPGIISLKNTYSNVEYVSKTDIPDIFTPLPNISLQKLSRTLPSEWDPFVNLNVFCLRDVNPRDPKILDIVDNFRRTSRDQLEIHTIHRIENPFLWFNYTLKKLEMTKRDESCIEKTLFHGTNCVNVTSICRNNFDWKMHGTNRGHKFGKGVSFSPLASYASHYTDRRVDDFNKMFVARVLVSKTCQGDPDMLVPPKGYDTSVNHEKKVYVKYDDHTYYPEFLITYTGALRDLYMEKTMKMQSAQQTIHNNFIDNSFDYFNYSQQYIMPSQQSISQSQGPFAMSSVQNISPLYIPNLQPKYPIDLKFDQFFSNKSQKSYSIYGPEPWHHFQEDFTSDCQTSTMHHNYDRSCIERYLLAPGGARSFESQLPSVQIPKFSLHNAAIDSAFIQNSIISSHLLQNSIQCSQSIAHFKFNNLNVRLNERSNDREIMSCFEQNQPRFSNNQDNMCYNPQLLSRDDARGPYKVEVTDSTLSIAESCTSLQKRRHKNRHRNNFGHKVQQKQNNNNNNNSSKWQPWANESLQTKMKNRGRFLSARRGFP